MRAAVRDGFMDFTAKFEGVVSFMYLDVKGLVTTGIGNLIDPIGLALGLPFVHKDGTPASREEIEAEWHAVKAHQEMRLWGGGSFSKVTNLRLTEDGIRTLVQTHMKMDEQWLKHYFPDYDKWPADAQMALHSMAWANGAAFSPGYPSFTKWAKVMDFEGCAKECWIGPVLPTKDTPVDQRKPDPHNPGVHPRNLANYQLFLNAAEVMERGLDPEVLWYPNKPAYTLPDPTKGHAAVDIIERK